MEPSWDEGVDFGLVHSVLAQRLMPSCPPCIALVLC